MRPGILTKSVGVMRSDDLYTLPDDLPPPRDDGAADHLVGKPLPPLALPSTRWEAVRLDQLSHRWVVVYCYPRTGRPGEEPLGGTKAWNEIPGARGCTPQTCAYRDHLRDLQAVGAEVFGLSTQSTEYQRELVARLHLPFAVLSDADLAYARALRLPTFEVAGLTLLKRLTLIISKGCIVHCFYPVFPPDSDAERVLAWLQARTA
jgi:peroxiredoxin